MEKPGPSKTEQTQEDPTERAPAEPGENKNGENQKNDPLSSTEKPKTSQKSVTICDTRIEISDTEDEFETASAKSNPKITISEPVSSPNEYDYGDKKEEVKGRCPIYYGIKSYIHDFYQPPDKELLKSGEYIEEDDFQFLVVPERRRSRHCWLRAGLWLGVNLIVLGLIAGLVGRLTPARQTIVGHQDSYDILDRWAVTFNNRLIICQFAGVACFTSGIIVLLLVILLSSYQLDHQRAYYVMAATVVPETFVGNPLVGPRYGWGTHRIPLTGSVREVQPTFFQTN